MTLGEKIQILRKQNSMSQEQLSALTAVSRQAISKWEVGESIPDVDNIVQLSEIFGVTTDYLLKNGTSGEMVFREDVPSSATVAVPTPIVKVSKKLGKTMVIAGLICTAIAGTPGVLWRTTSNLLFPTALVVAALGAIILFLQSAGKTQSLVSTFGAKLAIIGIIIVCVAGIPGMLGRSHADLLLALSFGAAWLGAGIVIVGYLTPYIKSRNKIADEIDLRPHKPTGDATQWKN